MIGNDVKYRVPHNGRRTPDRALLLFYTVWRGSPQDG